MERTYFGRDRQGKIHACVVENYLQQHAEGVRAEGAD